MTLNELIRLALTPARGRSLDDEGDFSAVVDLVEGFARPVIDALRATREYVDGSLDPDETVEGRVASAADAVLSRLGFRPPDRVAGRKHLRRIGHDTTVADWDLEALPPGHRELLVREFQREGAAEVAYGFVWRSRVCVLRIAPGPLPLRQIPTPVEGLDLLVGRPSDRSIMMIDLKGDV